MMYRLFCMAVLIAALALAGIPSAAADNDPYRPYSCRIADGCIPDPAGCASSVENAFNYCLFPQIFPLPDPTRLCTDPAGCNKHDCPTDHDEGNDCHHRKDP